MVLSKNEGLVLYGLVRWPNDTDAELGKKLKLNRTTVTVIRQRLHSRGYYRFVYVPDFEKAGCEILAILYGEFQGTTDKIDILKEAIKDKVASFYHMITYRGQHLSLGASKNLTHAIANIKKHHNIHHNEGYLTDKRHNYIFYPLQHTQIPRYFDYAPAIAAEYNITHKVEKTTKENGDWKPTKKEQKIFEALIQNPGEKDETIAKKSQVSRQTVNTVRNKLVDEGVITAKVIPDMKKLGYNILAFTHLHMNPHHSIEKRTPHTEKILEDSAHILKICGELETIVLSIHKDFSDYKKTHDNMITHYREHKLLSDNPTTHIYPLEETTNLLDHHYPNIIQWQ